MALAQGLHPGVNEEVLHLFGCDANGVKFVRLKQGIGIGLGMASELVDNCGDYSRPLSRLLKLPRAEEVCPQDLRCILITFLSVEVARYAVSDCRLAGSHITGQPEDRWTVGCEILCPSVDTLQYAHTRLRGASFTGYSPSEIGIISRLWRTRPVGLKVPLLY